jgi:hypothetical protein
MTLTWPGNLPRLQERRLLRRYEEHGDAGLVHGLRGRTSNNRIEAAVRAEAVRFVETLYRDYGPTLASEVLAEDHGIVVSRESLRQWIMVADLWHPRGARVHLRQWRERKACLGEMAQMDTSIHGWSEGRGECAILIGIIDNATSRLLLRFSGLQRGQ